jgi:hypothetical protein
MTEHQQPSALAAEALERLRVRGAQRLDPLRWHLAQALARRASAHEGEARRAIDARLASVVEAMAKALAPDSPGLAGASPAPAPAREGAPPADARAARPRALPTRAAAAPGPLAALLAHAGTQARVSLGKPVPASPGAPARAPVGAPSAKPLAAARGPAAASRAGTAARPGKPAPVAPTAPPAEPPALQYFRRVWSRLNVDERLAESRASLPGNAGPLNSHHLVHRALLALQEIAPAYLEHFISHVDDLAWMEAAADTPAGAGAPTRDARDPRPGRGR